MIALVHLSVTAVLMTRESMPTSIKRLLGFAGETRTAECGRCGATFEQFKLPESFRRAARKHGPALDTALPDGFTPRFCPPCERRDLGRGHEPPLIWRQTTADGEPIYEREERRAMQTTD